MLVKQLTKQRFGRLVAQSYLKGGFWLCQCDCGNTKAIGSKNLMYGRTRSCGCLMREVSGTINLSHGKSKTPEYSSWYNMVSRCTKPLHTKYADYGGRGITVTRRWLGKRGFVNFLNDMGAKPSGTTIERIDNAKGYSKANCRWATRAEQAMNTRRTRWVTYMGQTKKLRTWCDELGIKQQTVYKRVRSGRTFAAALARG